MTTRLSFKIFAAFLLTFFAVLALMIGSIRFLAYQNFSDYVHKVEIEMLDQHVDRLGEEYAKNQGWEPFEGNTLLWYRTLGQTKIDTGKADLPTPPGRPGSGRNQANQEPRDEGSESNPLDKRYFMRMLYRLTLFDARKSPVVGRGRSTEGHALRAIRVDGRTVGWLGLKKHERLSHPLDLAFLGEQFKVFYLVGSGMLVLAAVVSFFLSRHLLAPVRQLTAGTRALTSFKFETRIDVRTKDELGQLASDFNVMARTLEKSEQMRRQWITDISHELRTPLSILRGEIEAMQDGVRDTGPKTLESLHTEVVCLGKIVNDLHDLSLAETGALPFEMSPVDPGQVLRETARLFETRLSQNQLEVFDELGHGQGATLTGDDSRLTQLFSNLFENALRYADKPGTITIGQHREPGRVVLFFEDSGPGVPEEALERLFDRLYRVDPARTRSGAGSGLGLAICKSIVEAHGGWIMATNKKSGGLRFEMAFPITQGQL